MVKLMNRSPIVLERDLIIDVDFDNTIINYGNLFFEAGLSLGVLPNNAGSSKKSIREYLIGIGREEDWTRIQGLVCGDYIRKATMMDGFFAFTQSCYKRGWKIFIISHKTPDSIKGEKYDLHTSELSWLKTNRIYGKDIPGTVMGVFFEATRFEKICRINHLGCDVMIDDLPEVLLHPDLPKTIIKILYDPNGNSKPNPRYVTAGIWDPVCRIIERHYG